MNETAWVRSPVGRADRHYATRRDTKTVLVVVPHPVAGTRLFDLLPLLEADHRVQVVFADPEAGDNWPAGRAFLHAHGGVVLPWPQARRSEFDLVLAGSTRGLDDLSAPTLLVPHGGGFGQYRPWRPPDTAVPRPRRHGTGLSADQLLREGRLRADALALVHDRERALLARECPQALPAAVVTGDIALDRLTASLPHRDHYRRALGATAEQEVVVVTSTWSPRSAFGRHPGLFDRVLAELPGFRVAGLLHPNIWAHHGAWQVRSWLADARRAGLVLVPPEEGWRAALAAADHVLGDYGSVTAYAAAAGAAVLLEDAPDQPLLDGSPAAVLARHAPRHRHDEPLAPQLAAAREARDGHGIPELIRGLLSSRPGEAGKLLRHTMYRLLDLPEPARAVPVSPVPLPVPA